MKIIYDDRFTKVYASDPAAAPGRMECIVRELEGSYDFIGLEPASEEDILIIHSRSHLNWVRRFDVRLFEIALLAAGGAIKASQLAMEGQKAFALIRPPGHHASPDSCWGFCYFNNIAIAVEKLRKQGLVNRVLIVDIDLHYGDGTNNIFFAQPDVVYHHVEGNDRRGFIKNLESCLEKMNECDLVAISAGFDKHASDWGGVLLTEDYALIGEKIKVFAAEKCKGKVFAVLEGGYNHSVLGKNVKALTNSMI